MKNWKEVQLSQIGVFKEEATKQQDKIQGEVVKAQSLLQKQDIAIGTLISELKQGDCQWNIDIDNTPGSNQYKFGEHREELVANLISELSSEEGITSHILNQNKLEILKAMNY